MFHRSVSAGLSSCYLYNIFASADLLYILISIPKYYSFFPTLIVIFSGDKIPHIEYTEQEISTWRTVYNELVSLYPTHACQEFNYIFPLLQQNCGFGPNQIPQLQDVSDFLHGKSTIPVCCENETDLHAWLVMVNV